jgi:hypothetical protein
MFKGITRGLSKFFTTQRTIFLVIVLILAFILYNYSGTKKLVLDGYNNSNTQSSPLTGTSPSPSPIPVSTPLVANTTNTNKPTDLLPIDNNSQFSNFNMLNQENVVMPDLLDAGYLIGLDTIGQSLRNPNYQERSDPIIPKVSVGPWNNSTIEPDLGRVPLEIGVGMR